MFYKLLSSIQLDSNEINPSLELISYRNTRFGLQVAMMASLIIAIISLINVVRLDRESNWIKRDATLLKAVVEDTGKGQELKVTYQYKVGSKTITATETQRGIASNSEKERLAEAERIQTEKNRLENIKNFSVYYNPSSPIESRIATIDHSKLITYFAALGGVCVFILIASLLALSKQRKPTMPSIKEHAKMADAQTAEHNRGIVDSLRDRRPVIDDKTGSGSPESISLGHPEIHQPEAAQDGTTIDIKNREKETI